MMRSGMWYHYCDFWEEFQPNSPLYLLTAKHCDSARKYTLESDAYHAVLKAYLKPKITRDLRLESQPGSERCSRLTFPVSTRRKIGGSLQLPHFPKFRDFLFSRKYVFSKKSFPTKYTCNETVVRHC